MVELLRSNLSGGSRISRAMSNEDGINSKSTKKPEDTLDQYLPGLITTV